MSNQCPNMGYSLSTAWAGATLEGREGRAGAEFGPEGPELGVWVTGAGQISLDPGPRFV